MIGHLYIVNNEEEHGLNCFKVGFTNDLKRRLDDFNSATTTIGEYKLQGYIITKDVEEVEKKVHKSLNSYRVRRDREFFRCSLSIINNAILENSHDLIFENHLRGGVFITPQGKKYKNFYNKLHKLSLENKLPEPPKPPSECIGGPFCGCITYEGKSYERHSKNWGKIINWSKKNNFYGEVENFLATLENEDIVYNND